MTNDPTLEAWAAMLQVMPVPAALVDSEGIVMHANRWIEVGDNDQLVQPASQEVAPGLVFGVDGSSRWRVRPLNNDASVLLATADREDAGDHLLRKFFASSDALFVVYDQAGRVIESNAAWEQMLGYDHDAVFGLDSWTLLPSDDLETRVRVEEDLRTQGRSEPAFRMRTADGSYRLVQWALQFDNSVGRCFGVGRDITEEDRAAAELHRRAFTDELTGLANRAALVELLDQYLKSETIPAVLFCDLDHFKVVNDSLGHFAGDLLLTEIAKRLDVLCAADSAGDAHVGRLGGDEFVVLLGDSDIERAELTAMAILDAMAAPFTVLGRPVHASLSLGIALAEQGSSRTSEQLLGEADTAAYKAKELGRGRSVVYDSDLRASVKRRFNVESELRFALEHNQFEVHYQPIVGLPGGGVVGVEALVRWRNSLGDLVLPGRFLDVAEAAGLMPQLGDYVMVEALKAGAEIAAHGRELLISVNVSSAEVAARDFAQYVTEAIDDAGFDPRLVLLEITESTVIDTESALPAIRELHSLGVKIGLDDFGTGFSSLSHLRDLPINVVKVDRSFVAGLTSDDVTLAVTSSILQLSRALGLDVILEGIEHRTEANLAEQLGAKLAQGYLFHKPMPLADLRHLLGIDRPEDRVREARLRDYTGDDPEPTSAADPADLSHS